MPFILYVKTLFTSMPVDPAISIIIQKLQEDSQLHSRTSMSIQHFTSLLEFYLKNTYFLFQGKYYEQVHGRTMHSISPIVANLFMGEFELKAISTATHPPRLWYRYVDDTFVIQKAVHSQQFLHHINSIDPHIHFFTEVPNSNGSIPFWTLLSPLDLTAHY